MWGIKGSCRCSPTSLVFLSRRKVQEGWAAARLRLPSTKGLSQLLPEDLPALTTDVLRERQLHIGGPVLRVDLQELQGEKSLMPGLGDGCGFPTFSPPSPRKEGQTLVSHQPLDGVLSFCSEWGANSPCTWVGVWGRPLSLLTQSHQHSTSVGRGCPALESERPVCHLGSSTC